MPAHASHMRRRTPIRDDGLDRLQLCSSGRRLVECDIGLLEGLRYFVRHRCDAVTVSRIRSRLLRWIVNSASRSERCAWYDAGLSGGKCRLQSVFASRNLGSHKALSRQLPWLALAGDPGQLCWQATCNLETRPLSPATGSRSGPLLELEPQVAEAHVKLSLSR